MKKIITLVAVLLVLVVAGSFYYQSSKKTETNSEASLSIVTEQTILLYPLSGDVSFKATPTDDFQKVTASPTVIPNKAIVHTGLGKASVLLPDNSSISLENNTEITVNYSDTSISIYQSLGTTYHRVQALLSGKTYQVQTAGTLAAVRGTKFAVKYDDKTKKTKIAVTENKVQVSSMPKTVGTTTPSTPESVVVDAGKTISVEEVMKIVSGKPTAMHITETTSDPEMKVYVEEQKKVDVQFDAIKKESVGPEEFRKEIKKSLFKDESEEPAKENVQNDQEKKTTTEEDATKTKTEDTVKKEDTKKVEEVTKPKTKEETVKPTTETPVVKKMEEEAFFNAFEPLFIKYFYLDEQDSACNVTATPEERAQIVTTFAIKNGYPFTKTTSLLPFAQAIDAYCKNKDDVTKIKLQSRFDDEYPYE